jgi:transposase
MDMPMPEPVRRIEVITGDVGRRIWTDDQKASIVAECLLPGRTVSAVARSHGMSASQLFSWRRQLRRQMSTGDALAFVPAVVAHPEVPALTGKRAAAASRRSPAPPSGPRSLEHCVIVIEIGGAVMRIRNAAETKLIASAIAALRGNA